MKKVIIDNVTKYYNKKAILSNIDFFVRENECVGIMGKSGSGKSTLAKLIVGLEHCDKGDIIVNNVSYKKAGKKELNVICRQVQLVFQNALGAINSKFTVEKVLMEPLNIHYKKSIPYGEKRNRAVKLLEKVGLSSKYLSYPAVQLSGGQLQRVCIARALILKPEIIIFDESLSGLDPIIQRRILELLGNLKKEMKLTYILISHDFENCYYLCDRVIIMENGEIKDIISNLDSPIEIKSELTKKIIGKSLKYIDYVEKYEMR